MKSKPAYYLKAPGFMLPTRERECLRTVATIAVARFGSVPVIVNIGVARGGSLHCLRAGAPDALLIGIDADFNRYPIRINPGANLIWGRSQDVCVTGPVHLVFVDGSHTYESVRGDIENWAPRVMKGGFVLFHDYGPVRATRPNWTHTQPTGLVRAINEWRYSPEHAHRWREFGSVGSIVGFERYGEG